MTVYIVLDTYDSYIHGVFSDKEKAEQLSAKHENTFVAEHVVDEKLGAL